MQRGPKDRTRPGRQWPLSENSQPRPLSLCPFPSVWEVGFWARWPAGVGPEARAVGGWHAPLQPASALPVKRRGPLLPGWAVGTGLPLWGTVWDPEPRSWTSPPDPGHGAFPNSRPRAELPLRLGPETPLLPACALPGCSPAARAPSGTRPDRPAADSLGASSRSLGSPPAARPRPGWASPRLGAAASQQAAALWVGRAGGKHRPRPAARARAPPRSPPAPALLSSQPAGPWLVQEAENQCLEKAFFWAKKGRPSRLSFRDTGT